MIKKIKLEYYTNQLIILLENIESNIIINTGIMKNKSMSNTLFAKKLRLDLIDFDHYLFEAKEVLNNSSFPENVIESFEKIEKKIIIIHQYKYNSPLKRHFAIEPLNHIVEMCEILENIVLVLIK